MRMPDARRWAQLSPALDELLELPPDAQSARLASLHGTDPALAHEPRTLLQAGQRASGGALLTGDAGLPALAGLSLAGQRIGAYRLEASIGRGGSGGSGAVWRARRADGQYEGCRCAVHLGRGAAAPASRRSGQHRRRG